MPDDDHRLRLVAPGFDATDPDDLPPELLDGLTELLANLGVGDEPASTFEADWRAAGVAAGLRLAIGDRALLGGPGLPGTVAEDDLVSDEDLALLSEALVAGLAALARRGRDDFAFVLSSLAIYGGPMREWAAEAQSALDAPADPIPLATPVAAHRITTIPGDEEEIVLELAYPDDRDRAGEAGRRGIAVLLDTFGGRRPIDVLACDDVDGFLDEATDGARSSIGGFGPHTVVTELAVPDALSVLAFALWLFDHTLDAAEALPEDSDLPLVRPLLDRLLAAHPHPDHDLPEVAPSVRRETAAAFTKWVGSEHPEVDDAMLGFVDLLVDFAADQADDPERWSATVAVNFLHMACQKVMAPVDELAALPDLVRLMVVWAHGRKGWPTELTDATLAAIDDVQPLFDAELEAQDGSAPVEGLVEPPRGGSHPEPFDDSRIDEALRNRAARIAEEATDRAVELFDPEFATLVRRLVADAARLRSSPLARGKIGIWAAGAVYAVAQLNEIPGGWSPLARPAAEITDALEGAPNTIANKARALRQLVDADSFPPAPRYQHSTSVGATADILVAFERTLARFGLGDGPDVELDPGLDLSPGPLAEGGRHLRLVEPAPMFEPGSVDPATVGGDCFVLRVALADIRPEIWRRVRLPVDATFGQLHRLLQLVFGWYDGHLHLFEVDGQTIGPTGGDLGFDAGDGDIDEDELRLCDAMEPGSSFVYLYDFGDNWEHRIVVEGTEGLAASTDIVTGEPMGPFALLAGKRAGPPEDCGGWPGYADILAARKDERHPRRAELADWLPVGFDPDHFDVYTINQAVHRHPWD